MRQVHVLLKRIHFRQIVKNLSKYGLEGEVEAINHAGVELARKAVGDDAYVVGAIGSIRAGKRKNVTYSGC